MSYPIMKELSKGILVTIRLIKVILPSNFPKRNALHIVIKFGDSVWDSTAETENSSRIHWRKSHTFEISEISPMYIGVFYKKNIFIAKEFSSCVVKSENFSSKKGVKYTELYEQEQKLTIFWTYVIEEDKKGENKEYVRLINEIEAEREEIKYKKNKVENKLRIIKEKRIESNKEFVSILSHRIQHSLELSDIEQERGVRKNSITESRRFHAQDIDIIDEILDY